MSVPQTLKAADAVPFNVEEKAADHVGLGEIYADAENRIFLTLSDGDEASAPLQTGTFIIQLDGEELARVTVSNLPAYSLFLNINAVEYQVEAWGDSSNITVSKDDAFDRRGYKISNLTPRIDTEYTVTVNFTAPAVKDHDAIVIQDNENFYGTFYWTKGTATADDFARPIKVYVDDALKYDGTIQTPKDLSQLEYWFEANLEKYTSEVRIDSDDLDQYTRKNVTVYLTTKCPCGKENCQCAGSCDCISDCNCPECVPVEGEDMIVTPYGTITYDDDAEGVKVKMSVEIYVNGELATTTKQFTTTSAVHGSLGFSANEAHGYHFFAVGEAKNSYDLLCKKYGETEYQHNRSSWYPTKGDERIVFANVTDEEDYILRIYTWTFDNYTTLDVGFRNGTNSDVTGYYISYVARDPKTGEDRVYSYPATSFEVTQPQIIPFGREVTLTAQCVSGKEVTTWRAEAYGYTNLLIYGERGGNGPKVAPQDGYGNAVTIIPYGSTVRELVNIYIVETGNAAPEKYHDGDPIQIKVYLKDKDHDVTETWKQYITLSDDTKTQKLEYKYNKDTRVIDATYQYEIYNCADISMAANTGYTVQAVKANLVYGQEGSDGITAKKLDNVQGGSTVEIYLAPAYTVEYYVGGNDTESDEYTDAKVYSVDKTELTAGGTVPNEDNTSDEDKNHDAQGMQKEYPVTWKAAINDTITLVGATGLNAWYPKWDETSGTVDGNKLDTTLKLATILADTEGAIYTVNGNVIKFFGETANEGVDLTKSIVSVKRGETTLTENDIPATLKVDDVVTYQVEVENTGNVALSGLTITDTLTARGAEPKNLADDSGEFAWKQEAGNWIGTVSNVELAASETKTYKYTYTVDDADKGKTINNAAEIAGKDPEDPEDGDETKTEVENPDVTVTKSLTAITRNGEEVTTINANTELKVGDEITYEIKVKNTGNVNLSGLTVTDEFSGYAKPGDIQESGNPVTSAVWQEGKTDTDPNWTLTIDDIDLDVRESKTYTYTYTVNQADADKNLTNTAAVTGDELDPDDPDDEGKDERPVKDDGDITLQPADITIYMGGEKGYTGVVDGEGNIVQNGNGSESLPEPGFYFTLPDEINQELSAALGEDPDAAVDLSKYITVTAMANDDKPRTWTLKQYGATTSTALIGEGEAQRAHFVYEIEPAKGQDPIRVQFTHDGKTIVSDEFDVTNALYEEYGMSLYLGGVDPNTIAFVITIPASDGGSTPAKTYYCGFKESEPATLTVRYASDAHTTTKAVTSENDLNPDTFGVVVGSKQLFNINQKDEGADGVDVTAKDVSLLVDSLVGGEDYAYTSELYSKAVTAAGFKSSGVWGQYLDLVDAENGNAWLTPEGEVTVFWPYPAGVTKDTGTIKLYHFEGLDRDMATGDVMAEINNTDAVEVQITRLDDGFTFKTSSFSPFVLVQDTTQPSGGEDKPSGGDDGNNDNNNTNHNTNTNNQTTTVNVANQAAAPAAAPAAAIPQTGDAMPVGLLGGLAAAAAAGFAALFVIRKRKQNG